MRVIGTKDSSVCERVMERPNLKVPPVHRRGPDRAPAHTNLRRRGVRFHTFAWDHLPSHPYTHERGKLDGGTTVSRRRRKERGGEGSDALSHNGPGPIRVQRKAVTL